jgi:hypothetical protein
VNARDGPPGHGVCESGVSRVSRIAGHAGLNITFGGSEVFEPLDDVFAGVPAAFTCRAGSGRCAAFDRFSFHGHVDLDDSLDARALLVIADTLSLLPEVPGVLLERREGPFAAISRAKVAAALPLSLLSEDELRGEPRPTMPGTRYVCRKCVPHSVHISLAPSPEAPSCRKVWFHGPMTPDG